MKFKTLMGTGLLALLAVSCTLKEPVAPEQQQIPDVTAAFESVAPASRVSVGADKTIVWDAADEISVFYRSTGNLRFALKGEVGSSTATFASTGNFATGERIPYICGFYPYSNKVTLSADGTFGIEWPAVQTYAADSFGPKANLMAAVSEDGNFLFRNIGGYLVLPLYGDKAAVESVTLKGNAGERLAGPASVYASPSENPTVEMGEEAVDAVTLKCAKSVLVGETEDDATEFWFVLPPVKFTEGFTVVVKCNGEELEFSADNQRESYEIIRNTVFRMDPLCVKAASIDVTGVSVAPATLSLAVGESARLSAVIEPQDATYTNVTWASSDEEVVTVDENGTLKALAVGTATVTVTTEDGGFEAECTVEVTIAGVKIPYSKAFTEDLDDFSEVVVINKNEFDVWTHSENYGACGTAFVDLDGDGKKDYVEAESHLASPFFDLRNENTAILSFRYAINYGDPSDYGTQFWVEVSDGEESTRIAIDGLPIRGSWSWYNAAVNLTPFCGKTVRVEFVYNSVGLTDAAPTIEIDNMAVSNTKLIPNLKVPAAITIMEGKDAGLEASVNSGAQLSYSSSATDVVTVDADGLVHAVKPGVATISVTAASTDIYEDAAATCEVTVTEASTVDYSDVFTSNVDLSTEGGTSAAECKVIIDDEEYDGLKAGTGKVYGILQLTVPAGTKKLHLHAFGWKNTSASIAVTQGNTQLATLDLKADDGVSNNSPFTLTTAKDSYFCVDMSSLSAAAGASGLLIKLTATGAPRFVVWGVNAE
ncbi:MAG: Ig-like domain-containing protein [Bacteroidales bacterium]|nr:Ig-like domain-containing protein [Bacteroidales bacterium]